MSVPYENIIIGTYTSDGTARDLELPFIPDSFEIWNLTNQGSSANPGVVKRAEWFNGMDDASAFVVKNTAGLATDTSSVITTGGFTPIDGTAGQLGPQIAITSISQANPALVTTTAPHGLATGDIVGLYNTTAMLQVATIFFVITVTGATTFTIELDTTGFAAAATGGFARKVNKFSNWVPPAIYITNITQANPGVVTTSVEHGYATGDIYRLHVPAAFGMVEADGLQVTITVLTATTFSIGVDTTTFTAFAFPASADVPVTFPIVDPVGEFGTALTDSVDNTASYGIQLGTVVVGANNDVVFYRAIKGV